MNRTIVENRNLAKSRSDLIVNRNKGIRNAGKRIKKSKYLLLMIIPAIIFYVVFCYVPMYGVIIAFKTYFPKRGIWGSPWAEPYGLGNFAYIFEDEKFWQVLGNTLLIGTGKIIISFVSAIIVALLINEIRMRVFKKTVQIIVTFPHFLSWVIMYGVLLALLSPSEGILNDIIKMFGGTAKGFLTDSTAFPIIVILSDAWKEIGWSAIIFIAALMGIDGSLFEAAIVEGANSWQRVRYITLPSIKPVIVIVLLMKIGTILDAGFNQLYMLQSDAVLGIGDIIDTWVYRGTIQGKFSLATAAGIFKGVIGMTLLFVSNWASRKFSENSLF